MRKFFKTLLPLCISALMCVATFTSCDFSKFGFEIDTSYSSTEESNKANNHKKETDDQENSNEDSSGEEKNEQENKYQEALALIEKGKYEEAYEIFESLGNYKNSKEILTHFRYVLIEFKDTSTSDTIVLKDIKLNDSNLPSEIIYIDPEQGYDGRATSKFKYDSNGNIIEEIRTNYEGKNSIYSHSYDNSGNLIKFTRINYDSEKTTYDYSYDTNGNLIKEVYTSPSGSVFTSTYEYLYDSNNNLIKKIYISSYGREINEYFYNADGDLIKQVYTDSRDQKTIYDYHYNEDKKLIKEICTSHWGHVFNTEYTYDLNGYLIRETTDSDIFEYTYDLNGNLIKEVRINEYDGYVLDYTYDSNNNLIKEVYTPLYGTGHSYEFEYKFVYIPFDLSEEVLFELEYLLEF